MTENPQGAVGGNTPGDAKQLFLSYGRQDNVNVFVSQLKQDLEQRGFTVWMDRRNLSAGVEFNEEIGRAILNCSGLIAVITKKYVSSDYCSKELLMAANNKKKIFRIEFEENVDFKQGHGPGMALHIQGIQYVPFRPGVDDHSQSLDQLVDGLIQKGIQPGPVESTDFDSANGGNVPVEAKQLFLSYGHDKGDVNRFAKQLKKDLEGRGFTVWMDVDIPAGAQWVGGIGSGIHHCKGLIAVITNKYVNSEYCTGELSFAKTSKKKIFPIRYEESVDFTKPPHAPGVNFIIHKHQWTDFRPGVDEYSESLGKLVRGLEENGIHPGPVEDIDTDSSEAAGIKPKYLNIDDLNKVQKALGHFAKWRELGLGLGLSANLLDVIRDEEPRVRGRVEAVLSNWLNQEGIDKTKKPTWHQLVAALEEFNYALAQEIKEKYLN